MGTVAKSTQVYSEFHPGLIAPLHVWYDSADSSTLSLTGSTVQFWRDKSGNNYTLSAGGTGSWTGPTYDSSVPSLSSGALSTVRFSLAGFVQGMVAPSLSLSAGEGVSIAMVAKYGFSQVATVSTVFFAINQSSSTAPATTTNVLAFTTGVSSNSTFPTCGYYFFGAYRAGSRGVGINISGETNVPSINSNWNLHQMFWEPANSQFVAATVSRGSTSVPTSLSASNAIFYMGAEPTGAYALSGNIAEFIMYRGRLTERQRAAVSWYLTQKWNLPATLIRPYTVSFEPYIRPFHPFDVPSLLRWYDAADSSTVTLSTLSSSRIVAWFDKSTNNSNVSSIESQFPFASSTAITYSSGSLGNAWNTITLSSSSGGVTFNETTRVNNANTVQSLVLYANTTAGSFSILRNLDDTGTSTSQGNIVLQYPHSTGVAATVVTYGGNLSFSVAARPRLAIATVTSNQLNLYESGIALSQYVSTVGIQSTNTRMMISATGATRTEIGEILAYSNSLTFLERSKLEGYLAWKWNTTGTLPATHPYKLRPPYEVAYSPNQLYLDLPLWIDAADSSTLVVDGTNQVQRWSNKGSLAGFLSYGTGGVRVFTVSQNGLGVVSFGCNAYLGTTFGDPGYSATARTYAFVGRVPQSLSGSGNIVRILNRIGTPGEQVTISKSSVSQTAMYFILSAASTTQQAGTIPTAGAELSTLGFFLGTMLIQPSTFPSNIRSRWNGSNIPASSTTTAMSITAQNLSMLIGGMNVTNRTSVSFDLCELIQVNKFLPLQDLVQMEGYLAWKWGLRGTLPATHPFKEYPP